MHQRYKGIQIHTIQEINEALLSQPEKSQYQDKESSLYLGKE